MCVAMSHAQEGINKPIRYDDEPKVVYLQNFEEQPQWHAIRLSEDPNRPTTFYTWQSSPIDSITKISYYKRNDPNDTSSSLFSEVDIYDGSSQWDIAGIRDTVIYLYDGIMRTDAAWPGDSILQWDSHAIMSHTNATQHGENDNKEYGLDRYWEDGGNQYFSYTSATSHGYGFGRDGGSGGWMPSHDELSPTQDHYTPDYRRNLFLNNIPIEDNSSYRVTVYVKPSLEAKLQKGIIPRIGVDLLRGSWHSEKPFMVDAVSITSSLSTKYATFNDKSDYTDMEVDKWNKVTLMAYYNNDSIGDASPYLLGYYWIGDWDWNVKVGNDGSVLNDGQDGVPATLKFIKQPDKFFIRMAFRSDSTQFDVDNISVTKSWIGGVEYSSDMLRVDFGYQTNLGELANKENLLNKIPALQLPDNCFDVWALCRANDTQQTKWEHVPIIAAEYHEDGYMYLFTEPASDGSIRSLDGADSVLVSFYNSQLPDDLKISYSGDLYPNGLDKEWVASGKPVFDFHNEIATFNSTIGISPVTKEPVKSIAELCPALQKEPYEDGTFGLDPKTRSFLFKFTKNLSFENAGNLSSKTKVILRGDGKEEYWNVVDYPADDNSGWTTIERPAEYTEDLAGDYVLSFEQVTHLKNPDPNNQEDYGDPVNLNYHFGDFDVAPVSELVLNSDWREEIVNRDASNRRPIPTSVYIHSGTDPFQKGQGVETGNKCGFYSTVEDSITILGTKIPDNGMFYLSNRTTGTTGNLYSIVYLNRGNYVISFKLGGSATTSIPMQLKYYEKPFGELEDGNERGYAELEAVNNKIVLETGKKPAIDQGGNYSTTSKWKEGIETLSYKFSIPVDGEYVFEWVAEGASDYKGFCISNYWITTDGNLSFRPVYRINEAIASAQAKLYAVADKFHGAVYDNLASVKIAADGFIEAKKATYVNLPSEYAAEVNEINDAVKELQLHMDTVDAFDKAYAAVEAKLAVYADSLKAFEGLAVVDDLKAIKTAMSNYAYSKKAPGVIATDIKTMEEAVKAVDDRQAINDQFITAIAEAEYSLANPKAAKYTADSQNLDDAIIYAESFDAIIATDDELRAQITTLKEAKFNLDVKILGADVTSVRINALDMLAWDLNANYGDVTDEINARIANIDFDDDDLAKIMKAAIKVALYKKIVESTEAVSDIDLTPFIKNYHLYTTPKYVERTDIKANSDEAKVADENGANIQHVQHQWNSGDLNGKQPIWIMILENDYENLYPGWTARATATGNCMVTPDNNSYSMLAQYTPVFDGQLAMEWNGKAELWSTVEDLPLGVYELGVSLKQNTGSGTTLKATASHVEYESKAAANDKSVSVKNMLVDDGQIDIDFILTSGSGWSQADNFTLKYQADDNIDYATALEYAEAEYYAIVNGLPYEPYHPESKVHRMYTDKVSVMAGKNVTIPIKMKNTDNITAFSLDVEIPSGTSFIGAELTGARSNGHGLSSNVSYDWSSNRSVVSFACLSLENKVFAGNDGVIVNITLNIPENMNEGEYSILLKNIEMTVSPTKKYNPESYSSIINVIEPYVPGDVNNDGSITITDAVGVVAFIIESNTQNLCRRAADADENGVIDVADAVWVVNRVVRKYNAPLRNYVDGELTSTLSLCGENAVPMSLPLNVEGTADEITAMQFKLLLPDNLSLKKITTDNNHLVMSNKKNDGSYTVVCFSLDNSSFAGNGNAAMVLDFASDGQFDGGVVSVENAQLVSPDLRSKSIGEVKAMLTNSGDQTRISDIESDGESGLFDMQGRSLSQPDGIYIRGGIKQIDFK